jgi:hypothetical protein
MQPSSRRILSIGWTAGALVILCSQIVAIGVQRVVLIGPAAVVLAILPLNFLVLWLLIRKPGIENSQLRGQFNRLGRFAAMATTGFVGSLLTIAALTIATNLTIAQIFRF